MKGQNKLDMITCPILDDEAGSRLKLVRMRMLMDQAEMGALLGVSQQQLSEIERGRLRQAPFTMARFKAVFERHWSFILTGSSPPGWSTADTHSNYWKMKLKTRRKPGSGAHVAEKWAVKPTKKEG